MPISMKKRYARSVRFRRIPSNNADLQQTRRFPIQSAGGPLVADFSGWASGVVVIQFDRPVIIKKLNPANTWTSPATTNDANTSPTQITVSGEDLAVNWIDGAEQVSPTSVNLHVHSHADGQLIGVPFEDRWIRAMVGEYLQNGTYVAPPM
jgi:hypothetical protein